MSTVRIRAGDVELYAELRDTPTAETLLMMLPVEGRATKRGDEFYFRVEAMMADPEGDQRVEMEVGELAYWIEGSAISVFFGPTPNSRDGEPRAQAPMNVLGKIRDNAQALGRLNDGVTFIVERAE